MNKIMGILMLLVYICVATALLSDAFVGAFNMANTVKSIHAMNRWGEAHEIARVILFLASDEASFISGIALRVDGAIVVGT